MDIAHYTLSDTERQSFEKLQEELIPQFQLQFPDPMAPKTVIIVPSLSLDSEILSKISGHIHYEERLLCLLLLLRMPRTQVIYLSSMPIDEVIVDYYLHLIQGITHMHARKRLSLLACYDASNIPLTEKILERPRLMERIRSLVPPGHVAHIAAFNVTPLEEQLALKLGFPLYGCPSSLSYWGSKSGSRELFRNAGIPMPPGYENLKSTEDVLQALMNLKAEQPHLTKAVLKLNEGFSGDGNAIYTFGKLPKITEDLLRNNLKMVASDMVFDQFMEKFNQMGGIVEAFLPGVQASPSVQCLINPLQEIDVVSTHDQILGGESGQVYLGARFPADDAYRREIGELGYKLSKHMSTLGVLGRFGVDFVSVKDGEEWKHYAIEINLRKGGTSHPYLMLQLLTGGRYDYKEGKYIMPNGQTRSYIATDALVYDNFKKLTPPDLIDVAICNNLHFDGTTEEGVGFHLIGAMSQHGKLGVVSIGTTAERAEALYNRTISVLLGESR
ncbi:MAG TPA: ATP-grasp domain-containing protein [Saprospiraceae bacterium]|nr:ATP-grasp domain-containing protein [Saprospiraceae bacterium]HNT19480.1 ATP-grasp domain-containing protein [Saprospiraceae bacterium]